MRTRILQRFGRYGWSIGLLLLAGGLPSCDGVDIGRPAEDEGAPVVTRVLIQDANSYQVIDLLNHTAVLKCSDTNPCPAGTPGLGPTACTIPDGMTEGTCDNPLSADNVFTVGDVGAVQVRIVVSKALDPAIEKVTKDPKTGVKMYELADPTAFGLYDANGMEVAADQKFYDATGSNVDSVDPIEEPFGPALVIFVSNQLAPSATYTVKLKSGVLKDKKGQALATDVGGPLKDAGYTFKTESLHAVGVVPEDLAMVAPNDVITVSTNADVDPASLKLTIKDGNGANVPNGVAFLPLDDKTCDPTDVRTIHLFITDNAGNPAMWMPGGTYTLTLEAKDGATGKASLDKWEEKITVTMTAGDPMKDEQAVENFLLPGPCKSALNPPDGGTTD